MIKEVNNVLNVHESNNLCREFVTISESKCDASFLIHYFLSYHLKNNRTVIFVSLTQSFSHYNTVAQKVASLNLNMMKESGKLIYIDGMKQIGEALCSDCSTETNENKHWHDVILNGKTSSLYNYIMQYVNSSGPNNSKNANCPIVIIDNLNVLITLGVAIKELMAFVQYLRSSIISDDSNEGTLIVLVTKDEDDDEMNLLWKSLQHQCSLSLEVTGLDTGYCQDVHGVVSIIFILVYGLCK